ncbi:MAG: hypothetical protein QW638_07725 [Candidatus Bathyarchaeia archaeon]
MDVLEKRRDWGDSFFIVGDVVGGKNEGYISALKSAAIYFLENIV